MRTKSLPKRALVLLALCSAIGAASSVMAQSGPTIELPSGGDPEASTSSPAETRVFDEDAILTRGLADWRQSLSSTSIGGYAELHYNLVKVEDADDAEGKIDLHRLVLFVSHGFTDSLRFYTEIEVEHAIAGDGLPGEVAIEQAFVDFDLLQRFLTLRAGIVLVPMGIINEWHEPPVFNGVERPRVDTVIIPTTWREAGIGIVGEVLEGLRYQLYVVSTLNPLKFSPGSGLRGGRQKAGEAVMNAPAVTGRIEYEPMLGLLVGASGYAGAAGPNAEFYDATGALVALDVPVTGGAVDVRLRRWGVEARALAAAFQLGDTEGLRTAFDGDGDPLGLDVASQLMGFYAELGWDLLSLTASEHRLVPFVRYERYDTMWEVSGRDRTPSDDNRAGSDLVFGLTYRPVPQVAFKGDVILRSTKGDGPSSTIVDLGVGVMF